MKICLLRSTLSVTNGASPLHNQNSISEIRLGLDEVKRKYSLNQRHTHHPIPATTKLDAAEKLLVHCQQ